ncbi:hypothetical protein [Psychrobacter pygoscelis]|uniref:hypothetical protein n=1 Tax=Psychrobacter pygoscelis TaxID=2488563 RepID=UPI00103A510B|nr:hypothetical protein [Psychrobacter pygoscelis]
MAGQAFGHDYKMEWLEQERFKQESSVENWIYIGADVKRLDMAKVGLTTGLLVTRASCSQNPFYTLLCGFKIKYGVEPRKVHQIEAAVIEFLDNTYERINHYNTNRPSEWFFIEPSRMRMLVHDFLYNNFNQCMHCYYCSERNIGVIYSWENKQLLEGTTRTPYRADDLSSLLVDPDCYMQGGCGKDCDCWD